MFIKKDLFLLVPALAVVVVPNAFANIPSTAYMEDYVATATAYMEDYVDNKFDEFPAPPVVNDATLTIQKNGTSVGTFKANQSKDETINITVPTGALASKDAVTTSEITDGTIATADIADNAITTAKIAASAVTSAKIKDLNVTTAKIAAGAVTSDKITDGTIATVDIADNAITTAKIKDLNVTTAKIAADAVTSAKIADLTITNDDIATDAAIAASKISGLAKIATSGSYNDLSNKPSIPSAYTLPVATTTVLGGVKQGDNVTIASDGKISVHAPYTLPVATTAVLGGVKQGDNVTIASDGKVSVATGTPSTPGVVKVGQIPSGSATSTTYATIWVE